jgi:hypothetical protein
MDSAQHCQDQAAECLRLMRLAQNKAEAEVLRNLSSSWSRLAGQIDRYNALMREQRRIARKEGYLSWRLLSFMRISLQVCPSSSANTAEACGPICR